MAKTPPSKKMPRGIPSTTPRKMPSRVLPPSTIPRQPPLVKGTSQSANVGVRSPRLKETVLPKKFRSSQPMKMPTRALTPATTPRALPPVKGKSQQAAPKLGGELPAYRTQGSVPRQQGFPDKPKAPRKMMAPPAYLTSKTVVRSPKVSLGTPGTKRVMSPIGSLIRTKMRQPAK